MKAEHYFFLFMLFFFNTLLGLVVGFSLYGSWGFALFWGFIFHFHLKAPVRVYPSETLSLLITAAGLLTGNVPAWLLYSTGKQFAWWVTAIHIIAFPALFLCGAGLYAMRIKSKQEEVKFKH